MPISIIGRGTLKLYRKYLRIYPTRNLVRKDKRSFAKNIESFLENVVTLLSDNSSTSRINFIELLLSEVKKNKNIFRIPYGVNEKDYLEFLIRREDKNVRKKLFEVESKYKKLVEN